MRLRDDKWTDLGEVAADGLRLHAVAEVTVLCLWWWMLRYK